MIDRKNGLTYADSGVDIDAGNRLVDLIKPMVRATARAGADAEIGGFGGLFDLKAAGFKDPVLVAATDGVGTKLKIAIETGLHGGIGIDLVAMSVNDLVVQGAEPLFFLDYFACGKLDPEATAAIVAGIAEGCRESGCALIGGETAEMPGLYKDGDYDLAGFAVGAAERGTLLPSADIAVGDAVIGLASSGVHSNGFSLVRKIVENSGLGFDAPAPFSPVMTLGGALLDADAALCEILPARDPRDRRDQGARPHHRRRLHRQHSARAAEASRRRHRSCAAAGAAGVQMAGGAGRHRRARIAAHLQLRHRHDRHRETGRDRGGHQRFDRKRRDRRAARRSHPCARASIAWSTTVTSISRMKRRVAILISGRGSNMAALIEAAKAPDFPAEIVTVISNRADAGGLEKAAAGGIPTERDRKQAVRQGSRRIRGGGSAGARRKNVELICLAGFMRLFTAEFVQRWYGKMLNIHPSLLPSFPGLDPAARRSRLA